ncbi:MAG: DUF799 family lipoprotein [Proteobacteria bacterium]|nr:DUF799 family lipoprotein [Pseudomonadota bacterium]
MTRFMKTIVLLPALVILITGCAKTVSFKLSDELNRYKPQSVVVMPVTIESDSKIIKPDILELVRSTAREKLTEKGYFSITIEEADKLLDDKNLLNKKKLPAPRTLGPIFRTDAVLYTIITEWNEDQLGSYASLKIGIRFLLYSTNGSLLWEGAYSTKQSDFRFDKDATELGVLKAYEARIQRLEDAIFLSLPRAQIKEEKQEFYRWLP